MLPFQSMSRDHRKLQAFQRADALVKQVYLATAGFPASERYGLSSQIRRAAVSVPTNIVEGCGRESEGDYLRFLDIAFASCRELSYLIDLSHQLGFLDERAGAGLTEEADHTAATLSALRKSLRS